jgi:acetylornithine deacetylase/succinyl-diaminopimelate desuccinylase-like protein
MTADQASRADEASGSTAVEDDAARICRDLIRIDSTNYGDGSGPGERAAAEYVLGQLTEVGLDPTYVESAPGRGNVLLRVEGSDRGRPALVVHGHLDVVPANAQDWQVDPFAGEERDGCLWGRGAVDMKDMDAMILANLRDLARSGRTPPRDLVFAFFADEEAGGAMGSHWVVEHRPEFFEGASEAISEVGGFSVTVSSAKGGEPSRAYLLQTAEKGIVWLKLHARGRAGHGSVLNPANAVVRLAQAIARIDAHAWPREHIASVRQLLDGLGELTGIGYDDGSAAHLLATLGGARGFVEATLQDTVNATMLSAGYKHNVIPQTASAALDCRFLPGHEEALMATLRELAGPDVDIEVVHRDVALETGAEGALVEAMTSALQAEDPGATILPYCLSGGTDNKALSTLGITGYGFAPLRLPADLDFVGMFHGIDERVPLASLAFGTRVLGRLLATC